MRILISGSREWTSKDVLRRELEKFPPGTVIIHGDARGADKLAGEVAEELGFEVEAYPADWANYGLGAGPQRNTRMLLEGEPTELLAFHADLLNSSGTLDMVKKCAKVQLPLKVFDSNGDRREDWEGAVLNRTSRANKQRLPGSGSSSRIRRR